MNWRKYVPRFAKRTLRSTMNAAESMVAVPQKSRDELHDYWKEPYDGSNQPEDYIALENPRRSEYLVKIVREHVPADAGILEIGCNVGRNLNYLHTAGFTNLSGIEISENAIRLLKASFPDLARRLTIYNRPVEEVIPTIADRQFDFVFTMAVLEHIHRDSEGVFKEIARVASKYLFTFEDEGCQSWRHFPRNYKKIFEPFGWKQVHEEAGEAVIGIGGGFVARLFVRG